MHYPGIIGHLPDTLDKREEQPHRATNPLPRRYVLDAKWLAGTDTRLGCILPMSME